MRATHPTVRAEEEAGPHVCPVSVGCFQRPFLRAAPPPGHVWLPARGRRVSTLPARGRGSQRKARAVPTGAGSLLSPASGANRLRGRKTNRETRGCRAGPPPLALPIPDSRSLRHPPSSKELSQGGLTGGPLRAQPHSPGTCLVAPLASHPAVLRCVRICIQMAGTVRLLRCISVSGAFQSDSALVTTN